MGMCFVPDCKHYSSKQTCRFFRFPKNKAERNRWISLIRRKDRDPSEFAKMCDCHFVNKEKKNGPTLFEHNMQKRFNQVTPERRKRTVKMNDILTEPQPGPSTGPQPGPSTGPQPGPSTGPQPGPSNLPLLLSPSSASQDGENYFLKQQVAELTEKLEKLSTRFSYEVIKKNDAHLLMYTGIPTNDLFMVLFDLMESIQFTYYAGWNVRIIPKVDQLLMTLMKLRHNFPHEDLSIRFSCSTATVTNIVMTWIYALHEVLFKNLMVSIPSRQRNQACLPVAFTNFKNCRIILDCTEIYSAVPTNMENQRLTYSSYKHRNTWKMLVGVAPSEVPRMAPPKFNYKETQENLGQAWRKYKKDGKGKLNYGEFQKQWHKTSERPWASSSTTSTTPDNQIAGPSNISSSGRSTTSKPVPEYSLDSPLSITSFGSDFNMMEVDNNIQGGQGAHASTPAAMSTSNNNKQLTIPRSIKLNTVTFRFKKSRIFYTYGYSFQNLKQKITVNSEDRGDQMYVTTPLAYLPSDMVGFYINPHEASILNNRGHFKINHCSVKVVPQGLRTAFDTNTSLTGTATSEHCAIGCYAIGLNHKMYATGHTYKVDATAPMIPTDVAKPDLNKILIKYYGDSSFTEKGPLCLGCPRHVDMYTCLRFNSNRKLNNYAEHDEGMYSLDRNMHRFNFPPKIGEEIINWEYTPRFGYISCKNHDIPYYVNDSDTCYIQNIERNIPQSINIAAKKDGICQLSYSTNVNAFQTGNAKADDILKFNIDGSKVFSRSQTVDNKLKSVVPFIMIGILPTPQLNPATDTTNFQNTAAYYSVECEMIAEYNCDSVYNLEKACHSGPDQAVFFPSRDTMAYSDIDPLGFESYGS